jgi:hypothetical protein
MPRGDPRRCRADCSPGRPVERNRALIGRLSDKLNALIAAEIGVDDGAFLPFKGFIDWGPATKVSVNL